MARTKWAEKIATDRNRKMTTITPGKFHVGQVIEPVHDGEREGFGFGVILSIKLRKNANPYEIKFGNAKLSYFMAEEDIRPATGIGAR